MSRSGDHKQRRFREKSTALWDADTVLSKEKQKARELRQSAWWKKKISTGTCYYCARQFRPEELTMDHKIPISRGGKSEKINLVPACKECNNKKKYMLPVEWEEYLKGFQGV